MAFHRRFGHRVNPLIGLNAIPTRPLLSSRAPLIVASTNAPRFIASDRYPRPALATVNKNAGLISYRDASRSVIKAARETAAAPL